MRFAIAPRSAAGARRSASRYADGAVEVAVAHELLGRNAAPAEPGGRAAGIGGLLPGDEGARLVIGAVAGGADQQPGVAGEVGVGMARSAARAGRARPPARHRRGAAAFVEPLAWIDGHPRRIMR